MDKEKLIRLARAMRDDAAAQMGEEHTEVLTWNTVIEILTDEQFANNLYEYYMRKGA